MKRFIVIPIIFLLLSTLACSFGSIGNVVGGAKPTEEKAVVPTSPFEVTPTAKSAEVSKKVSDVYDDFVTNDGSWDEPFVVTTQAQKGADSQKVSYGDGKMTFQFMALETYAYRFYNHPVGADVVMEAKYQAFNSTHNGIALICRATDKHDAWYEFRVTSTNLYYIFRYDKKLKEDTGQNPYVQLKYGGADVKTLFPTRENVIRATCKGSNLTLGANGVEIASVSDGDLSQGDLVGIGAMSSDLLPVNIKFDYFSVKKP